MSYTKQNFTDGQVLKAEHLNKMENGIADAATIPTASVGQTIVVEEVDANGKPTKWKAADYQEKICESTYEEIVPLTEFTPTYNSQISAPQAGLNDFEMEVGCKYKVVYDGVEYICEAFSAVVGTIAFTAVGNKMLIGGENTGEPFGVGKVAGATRGFVISLDMNSHSVQVFEEAGTPISLKYLENALPYYIDVIHDKGETASLSDDIFTCTDTVENVTKMLGRGRSVIVRIQTNSTPYVYLLTLETYGYEGSEAILGFSRTTNATVFGNIFKSLYLVSNQDGTFDVTESFGD